MAPAGKKLPPAVGTAGSGERLQGERGPLVSCKAIRNANKPHTFQLFFQPHQPPVMKLKGICFLINRAVINRQFRCLELGLHAEEGRHGVECDFVFQKVLGMLGFCKLSSCIHMVTVYP